MMGWKHTNSMFFIGLKMTIQPLTFILRFPLLVYVRFPSTTSEGVASVTQVDNFYIKWSLIINTGLKTFLYSRWCTSPCQLSRLASMSIEMRLLILKHTCCLACFHADLLWFFHTHISYSLKSFCYLYSNPAISSWECLISWFGAGARWALPSSYTFIATCLLWSWFLYFIA